MMLIVTLVIFLLSGRSLYVWLIGGYLQRMYWLLDQFCNAICLCLKCDGELVGLTLCAFLQVVFRPRQSKHKSLIAACLEFEDRLSECKDLLASLTCEGLGQLEVDRVCNWQV
jgi:hypothetical protein